MQIAIFRNIGTALLLLLPHLSRCNNRRRRSARLTHREESRSAGTDCAARCMQAGLYGQASQPRACDQRTIAAEARVRKGGREKKAMAKDIGGPLHGQLHENGRKGGKGRC